MPVAETVRGFKEVLEGKHDDVPEANFYMKGAMLRHAFGKSYLPKKLHRSTPR